MAYISQQLDQIILDVDTDYDGYTENQGDCDDDNEKLNPSIVEIYDGIDNNCNGSIDENWGTIVDIDNNSECKTHIQPNFGPLMTRNGNIS